jgi:molecular chaperone IbpA
MVTTFPMDLFNDPFFIGFGRNLERITSNKDLFATNYPPHNLIKIDEDNFRIELAVAGFSKQDISIDLLQNELRVFGDKEETENNSFVHKGIASRNFQKFFALGEYIEVVEAEMKDGLLVISLKRNTPEAQKPKTIKIK